MENFTKENLVRQMDILPLEYLNKKITIIGAGAIGSFVALSLAKMGFEDLTVYDFDKIEAVNLNSQFYRFSDIGKFKVEALKDLIKDFTGITIEAKNQAYEAGKIPGIVISAVDSMKVRKNIWDNHKYLSLGTTAFIDGRMGAEYALVYTMIPTDPHDVKSYEKTLYTDENAVQERCTAKSTMYCVLSLSGLICKSVKDLVMSQPYVRIAQWNIKDNAAEFHLKK